eukprot:g31590.t1
MQTEAEAGETAAATRPDVDARGRTALHLAALKQEIEEVEHLLANGVAIETTDREGRTPLHLAAENGHLAIVDRLLAARAVLDTKADKGLESRRLSKPEGRKSSVTKRYCKTV